MCGRAVEVWFLLDLPILIEVVEGRSLRQVMFKWLKLIEKCARLQVERMMSDGFTMQLQGTGKGQTE